MSQDDIICIAILIILVLFILIGLPICICLYVFNGWYPDKKPWEISKNKKK